MLAVDVNRDEIGVRLIESDGVLLFVQVGLAIGVHAQPDQVDQVAAGHARVTYVNCRPRHIRLQRIAHQFADLRFRKH